MIELLFKASLAIAIALVFYKIVLQKESFFATNRLYLLGCIILAFTLPFISLPKLVSQQGYLSAVFEKEILPVMEKTPVLERTPEILPAEDIFSSPVAVQNPSSEPAEVRGEVPRENPTVMELAEDVTYLSGPTIRQIENSALQAIPAKSGEYNIAFWIAIFYLLGIIVFSLNLVFQIGAVVWKILTATDKVRDGSCIIVSTPGHQAPCSFFKYIFIHPDDYDFKTYEQILAHEKMHVKLGHSLDMLLAELAIIVLWFNPLIWLFRKEIEKNNEYQTDAILLEKVKVKREEYQLNLLQIAVPSKTLNITTNYNKSLIKQRIMMMNSKRSASTAYWKYVFLAPLFFGMLLLINEPALGQVKEKKEKSSEVTSENKVEISETLLQPQEEKEVVAKIEENVGQQELLSKNENVQEEKEELITQRGGAIVSRNTSILNRSKTLVKRNVGDHRDLQQDITKGNWTSNIKNGQYCLRMNGSNNNNTWNITECFPVTGFQEKENNVFTLTRDSGALLLVGNLKASSGEGNYSFTANPGFKQFLQEKNITDVDGNMLFHLFINDVKRDYVTFLQKEYGQIEGDELVALAIHGVTKENFEGYVNLFQKYSRKKPSIDEVVGARIHGIDEAYVQEIHEMGFEGLTMDEMMSAKIHGVNAQYAGDLKKAGFSNLSMDEIVSAKIHGVNPATVAKMKNLGYDELDLDEIVSLQIHGVDENYISQLKSAGLENLDLDEVVSAKIHGLSPSSIQEIKALGFQDLDFDELLSAQIHGVDASYVQDLKKAGFTDLQMDQVISARIHGIDSNFINKARKEGYNLKSLDKYITLKIHGSVLESLKEE